MPDIQEIRNELRAVPVEGVVNMAGYETATTPFIDSASDAEDEVEGEDMQDALFDAHELLYAEEDRSVLLLLQGMDCSGKNGTIKHVVIAMNPAGVRIASFKEPTEAEREEHYLERYRRELPEPGQLVVFDRSHYEDVLVPRAVDGMPDDQFEERLAEINEFEQEIMERGTTLIKCMLHISFDEQRERFLRRLRRDDKRWKFAAADLETRAKWNEYQAAYGEVIARTSTEDAPWYVIPADHKDYRNWIIAHLFLGTIDEMGPVYPQPDFDLDALRARLAPPN